MFWAGEDDRSEGEFNLLPRQTGRRLLRHYATKGSNRLRCHDYTSLNYPSFAPQRKEELRRRKKSIAPITNDLCVRELVKVIYDSPIKPIAHKGSDATDAARCERRMHCVFYARRM